MRINSIVNQQMCWLFPQENSTRMILHLREYSHHSWRPYTAFPQYSVPDYKVPKGSKGSATYQSLRKIGWSLIPSDRAYLYTEPVMANSHSN